MNLNQIRAKSVCEGVRITQRGFVLRQKDYRLSVLPLEVSR